MHLNFFHSRKTMYNYHHLREGIRMLHRRFSVAMHGIKHYPGNAEQICKQIVKDCWNGTFFQVSVCHFPVFYMRDFGMCVEALLQLGYKKEVKKTLQFALAVYSRENKISTTISTNGKGFDVFTYAPDSLAFLLYSLRVAQATELVEIYKPFLEQQIQFFYDNVIVKENGLVRKDKNFSSIKDHAKRQSCCYDNCCAAVIARESELLQLENPLRGYNYKNIIKKQFWSEKYFRDTGESDYISGDANVFPFWFGIFTEKAMIKKSISAIKKEKLDQPFPLKYTIFVPKNFFFPLSLFTPNYEGNSIWAHLGLCFIDVVAKTDKKLARNYVEEYRKQIEQHKNFLELYDPDGKHYKTFFYYTDAGMLWAVKWLALERTVK